MAGPDAREQRAQAFFRTANDAALKHNFDYAIQMYQEACKLVPDNLVFRQALRGIERRKFGNDPAKVGRLVGARNHPIRLRAKAAKAKGQWEHVLEVCEEAFVNNPWDVAAAEDAADAAEHLGRLEMAEWLLEAVASQAHDVGFFRHLAQVHARNEHWQKAIQVWERVKKINPYDEEAGRQINALSASAAIVRSGLGDAIHREPQGGSGPEPSAPEEDSGLSRLSPEERLLKEVQEQPGQVRPYLELADHYRLQDRLDEAEKVLALGLSKNPDDSVLRVAHGEVQIGRLQKRKDALIKKSQAHPDDPDTQAKLGRVTAALSEYEINEFRRRLAQRPDDAEMHYQLGLRLAKIGRHDEAIKEFQQARSVPELKVQALIQAGLSFEANRILKLAERSYRDALREAEAGGPDNQAMLNELHYRLGRVAEAQGNLQAAEEHYNEVAANDYSYLDVAQRLRSLNPGA